MPSSSSGKWVARAAATGGGRTYRGQAPVNWYMALVLIILLGIGSVIYARSEYRSGAATNTTPPTKNTTWFAAFSFDVCGTQRSPVPSNLTDPTTQSFYTTGNGLIVIHPRSTSDAGTNAVLGKFVAGYSGMALSSTSVSVPKSSKASNSTTTTTTVPPSTTTTTAPATSTATTSTTAAASAYSRRPAHAELTAKTSKSSKKASTSKAGTSTTTTTAPKATTTTTAVPSTTYTNGETCPKGTKDAGKTGAVTVAYWPNAFAPNVKPTTVTGNPATLRFTSNQLITIGFVPTGTKLPKPTGTVVTALLHASTGAQTSTPTTGATTALSTTTTTPSSTTTTPSSTTTTGSTTTTTAPSSSTTTTTTPSG